MRYADKGYQAGSGDAEWDGQGDGRAAYRVRISSRGHEEEGNGLIMCEQACQEAHQARKEKGQEPAQAVRERAALAAGQERQGESHEAAPFFVLASMYTNTNDPPDPRRVLEAQEAPLGYQKKKASPREL